MAGLLQDPTFMLGAGLLAQGSGQGQNFGRAMMGMGQWQQQQQQNDMAQKLQALQALKLQQDLMRQPKRGMFKGADGYNYWEDTQERVLPNVTKPYEPQTEIEKLQNAIQRAPEGSQQRSQLEQALNAKLQQKPGTLYKVMGVNGMPQYVTAEQAQGRNAWQAKGMKITTNPDGTMSFTMGGGNDTFGTKANNDLDAKILDTTEQLARLNQISSTMKPELLTLGGKVDDTFLQLKDFFSNGSLNEQDQARLGDYTKFKRNTFSNINRTIKELTGAAMTNAEAKRIMAELPSVGEGWFDGDSPTVFTAKLDDAVKATKYAIARASYARRNGLNPLESGIDLADIPTLMNKRGTELEAGLRRQYPNASQSDIDAQVSMRLKAEFGLQ